MQVSSIRSNLFTVILIADKGDAPYGKCQH